MSAPAGTRLALPEVTLVCVDTRTPQLAIAAMQRCQAQIDFGAALLFTDPAHVTATPADVTAIPLQVHSVPEYSRFMLTGLLPHLQTSHFLVVQWDGYVLDASRWQPEFLDFDYIGAPLRGEPPERAVGNGGFSLRSRRLVEALSKIRITQPHPEDICICHVHRSALEQEHGIHFAPLELARRFAYERLAPDAPTFGFHGLFNMHQVMTPSALDDVLRAMPAEMARGLDAHDLCRSLIRLGRLESAALILAKRRQLGMRDRRSLRLKLQYAWARLLLRTGTPLRAD